MLAPSQLAALRHRLMKRRNLPRYADRQRAGLAELRIGLALAQKHIARRPSWRGLATINRDHRTIRTPDDEETPAAEARIMAVHNAQHQPGGNYGIHRV